MTYNQEKAKYLQNSTFLGGAILSEKWVAVVMVLNSSIDIWEETPPVRTFLIPIGKDNKKDDSICIIWDGNIWAFPMIVKERDSHNDTFVISDSVGHVYHSDIEKGDGEKSIRIDGQVAIYRSFSGLKNIHGTVYVVGTHRCVMRRDGEDAWTLFSSSAMEEEALVRYGQSLKKGSTYKSGFNCIDGFAADKDLYAAGDSSDVWRYTGKDWTPVDIGSYDENIISICCAEDGFVYLGTKHYGKLFKGKGDKWEEIQTPFKTDITSIASYKDKIYIATPSKLYEYDGKGVQSVTYNTPSKEVPQNTAFLDVRYGYLLSVGNRSISIYDGKEWEILYGASPMDEKTANILAADLLKKTSDLMDAIGEIGEKK